jgi:hypothetical protein
LCCWLSSILRQMPGCKFRNPCRLTIRNHIPILIKSGTLGETQSLDNVGMDQESNAIAKQIFKYGQNEVHPCVG